MMIGVVGFMNCKCSTYVPLLSVQNSNLFVLFNGGPNGLGDERARTTRLRIDVVVEISHHIFGVRKGIIQLRACQTREIFLGLLVEVGDSNAGGQHGVLRMARGQRRRCFRSK